MGRRKQADIDRFGSRCSHRAHHALLQDAQQLDLKRQRHVADFVEEQGAAICRLEKPAPRIAGAGEGALHMAEQLGFEQLLGNRPAVDGHERPGTRAGAVNGARQHLLAAAAVAANQHAGLGSGHHARFGHQFRHPGTAENDASQPFFRLPAPAEWIGRNPPHRTAPRVAGPGRSFPARAGCRKVWSGSRKPPRSGVDRIRYGAVGGQQDDRQGRPGAADFLEQGQAVASRKSHVADTTRGGSTAIRASASSAEAAVDTRNPRARRRMERRRRISSSSSTTRTCAPLPARHSSRHRRRDAWHAGVAAEVRSMSGHRRSSPVIQAPCAGSPSTAAPACQPALRVSGARHSCRPARAPADEGRWPQSRRT
jgi:hypothetical protein